MVRDVPGSVSTSGHAPGAADVDSLRRGHRPTGTGRCSPSTAATSLARSAIGPISFPNPSTSSRPCSSDSADFLDAHVETSLGTIPPSSSATCRARTGTLRGGPAATSTATSGSSPSRPGSPRDHSPLRSAPSRSRLADQQMRCRTTAGRPRAMRSPRGPAYWSRPCAPEAGANRSHSGTGRGASKLQAATMATRSGLSPPWWTSSVRTSTHVGRPRAPVDAAALACDSPRRSNRPVVLEDSV